MKKKEVNVSGRKYLIEEMTPLISNRVCGWLRVAMLKFAQGQITGVEEQPTPSDPQEMADGTVKFCWLITPMALSEETCEKIQRYALKSCSYFDAATNAPCAVMVNDRWADKDLEANAPDVDELITASLQFSISPFFLRGAVALKKENLIGSSTAQ